MGTEQEDKELFERYCKLRHSEVERMLEEKLAACRQPLANDIHEIRTFVDNINSAFLKNADGSHDYPGHHFDHYSRAKAAEAEQEFWTAAKVELAKGGVGWLLGALKIVALLAVIGLGVKFGWVKTP